MLKKCTWLVILIIATVSQTFAISQEEIYNHQLRNAGTGLAIAYLQQVSVPRRAAFPYGTEEPIPKSKTYNKTCTDFAKHVASAKNIEKIDEIMRNTLALMNMMVTWQGIEEVMFALCKIDTKIIAATVVNVMLEIEEKKQEPTTKKSSFNNLFYTTMTYNDDEVKLYFLVSREFFVYKIVHSFKNEENQWNVAQYFIGNKRLIDSNALKQIFLTIESIESDKDKRLKLLELYPRGKIERVKLQDIELWP